MSGHNKWSQIKNQKGAADMKRGRIFSKLLKAISIAAKTEANPQFNPRLRSAIEKAKQFNVPQDNIERAVSKASEEKPMEDIVVEAYGPEGVSLIIEGITDNTNRSISEIKHLLAEHDAKIATPGSVLWAFEKSDNAWKPKFPQDVSDESKQKIAALIEALEDHDDVQNVITNTASSD
ncbi:MAG: YebC/PmpR family DNA-binding transcriptional regulator [Patescibacteria group bacterium]|nr:YebC/PmpR family DNA-binding transcriptional regulator [Patescibacteria group bacterium]